MHGTPPNYDSKTMAYKGSSFLSPAISQEAAMDLDGLTSIVYAGPSSSSSRPVTSTSLHKPVAPNEITDRSGVVSQLREQARHRSLGRGACCLDHMGDGCHSVAGWQWYRRAIFYHEH